MSKPTAFPLDESRLPFEIPRDEPYREKIARLGQMITDRILINDMSDHIIGNELPVWMLFTVQQNAIPVDP